MFFFSSFLCAQRHSPYSLLAIPCPALDILFEFITIEYVWRRVERVASISLDYSFLSSSGGGARDDSLLLQSKRSNVCTIISNEHLNSLSLRFPILYVDYFEKKPTVLPLQVGSPLTTQQLGMLIEFQQ